MDDARGVIDRASHVASELTLRAGGLLRRRLAGDVEILDKGDHGDVVTALDYAAEDLIISGLRESFPDHRIVSEEAGELPGTGVWSWLVDPLDGTNNVALGLPVFGVCLTLCRDGVPVMSATYSSHTHTAYLAVRGGAAIRVGDGSPLQVRSADRKRTTVVWIQGHGVGWNDPAARGARDGLEASFKRTLRLWAPSVGWALLAEGRVGAVIAYESEADDCLGGVLLATAAGAVVTDFTGDLVTDTASARRLVVSAPDLLPDVVTALSP